MFAHVAVQPTCALPVTWTPHGTKSFVFSSKRHTKQVKAVMDIAANAATSSSLLPSMPSPIKASCVGQKAPTSPVAGLCGRKQRKLRSRRPAAVTSFAPTKKSVVVKPKTYRFFTGTGRWVYVYVDKTDNGTKVLVSVDQGDEKDLQIHWGVFRSSLTKWYHPEELVPPNSEFDHHTKAMRSPLVLNEARAVWEAVFNVPSSVAPVQFGFVPYDPIAGEYDGAPRSGRHFTVPIGMSCGEPAPYGAQLIRVTEDPRTREKRYSLNFAVFSKHATGMSLCLVRVKTPGHAAPKNGTSSGAALEPAGGYMEVALDPLSNKTGDVWHICLEGVKDIASLCYGWRAEGAVKWENGLRFHPGFILLDPYATQAVPVKLPEAALSGGASTAQAVVSRDKVGTAVLGSLSDLVSRYDWGYFQPRHRHAVEDSVILEINVREFTTGADARKISPERRGTFLGVIDRIEDIKGLGVTSVLISHVFAKARGAKDHQPISFFSPEPTLSAGSLLDAGAELRQMVQAMHENGIEVLLQVEFCITGEQPEEDSKLYSLQGLDAATYYRPGSFVLNAGHPVVRQLVHSSLRHWVESYQVDGFCIRNAENLTQDRTGLVLDAPPLCDDIAMDPVLRSVKLIASVSDSTLLPRGGERGFPHWGVWMEWNTRFIADSYAFWVNNATGLHSAIATRIAGSPDLFAAQWDANLPGNLACPRRPCFGINAPTPLGSPPLLELLNPPEGEGIGPEAECLARAMILMTLVSQGLPSFSLSSVSRPGLLRFAALAIRLRRKHQDVFTPPMLDSPREINWHGAVEGSLPDWDGLASTNPGVYAPNYLGMTAAGSTGPVYVGFNPHSEPVNVTLPPAPLGRSWKRIVDTSKLPPEDIQLEGSSVVLQGSSTYWVHSHTAVVFEAAPTGSAARPPAY